MSCCLAQSFDRYYVPLSVIHLCVDSAHPVLLYFFAKTKLHKQCFSLGKPKRSITRPMSAEQAGYSLSNKFTPVK